MKEITVRVKEDKYKFFLELIRNFDFVTISKEPGKKELLLLIAKGMQEANLAAKGRIKSRPAKSFLNEL
jgi:hypothetical protein